MKSISNPARVPLGLLMLAVSAVAASPAPAQPYPSRPIRLIVAFAPGGSVDLVSRLVAQKAGEALGQQIVIDNRPGAGGRLSAEIAARATPDGYTLHITSASLVVNAAIYRDLPYHPVKDFTPVTLLASTQNALAATLALPVTSVPDLIALAKKQPGKINYGSTGVGTSGHLTMEMFRSKAGIELVHVPYKAIGQTYTDLFSGRVSLFFPTLPGALPHFRLGKMRLLAVSGAKRSPALPDVPTVAEAALPGFEASTWYPILAPAGAPKAVVNALNRSFVAALNAPEIRKRLDEMGVEPVGSTPAQLAAHIKAELPKWAEVVRISGVRAD
ncbi:MAG: tripartite tricarboxylate transporter substrate binding protein [Betaproteobacteria bacterium]|nr:tripartite tricarboxylate transporter substrate binding protein [Betaproteobacteria bacterium]